MWEAFEENARPEQSVFQTGQITRLSDRRSHDPARADIILSARPILSRGYPREAMCSAVPEKVLNIVAEIDNKGSASLTRLTVLKKWFEQPRRLPAFGLWVARRTSAQKGKTTSAVVTLLKEARRLLGSAATRGSLFQCIDSEKAKNLHARLRNFHNEFERQEWGPVRIIHCWPILLVEEGLALHLGIASHPADGYKLAADWAKNYDARYGDGLHGTSRGKLEELVRFMFSVEALEDEQSPADRVKRTGR